MVLLFLVVLHLKSLHLFGRTNPIFFKTDILFIKFTPKFVFKDIINFTILFRFFFLLKYNIFFEAVNFLKADFVVSPRHIKPE
jgi:quinol-cytochrome oxidoreductase complex cytochrome b subunit